MRGAAKARSASLRRRNASITDGSGSATCMDVAETAPSLRRTAVSKTAQNSRSGQLGDDFFELVQAAGKEMILRFNQDQLLWLRQSRHDRFDFIHGAVLIVGALNKKPRDRAAIQVGPVFKDARESGGDDAARARAPAAQT